ncbi:MAG: LCP family protein [Spirochaetaceae bacterium]|jgi:anionic cell wall polymer biosynthesis LytR-Cps2A-Psr (LCP) family protein|nr:LCP family protein [Spirochaetaceae bacterium]
MKKQIDFSLFLLAGIVFIVAGAVVSVALMLNRDFEEAGINDGRAITTLFVIEHEGKPLGAYLLLYNQVTKNAAGFEIPGELGLLLHQINRVDRIDTVYQSGKIATYIREVEKLFDIKVNYNFVFVMKNLSRAVDLLEGVTVFIPGDIKLSDSEAVLFSSGLTKLDGDKAVEYLSYPASDYDIETGQQRSQRFFVALLKRFGEKKDYLSSSDVSRLFQSLIETNMGGRILAQFFNELSYINIDRFTIASVGGIMREVSGKKLLVPLYDGSLIKEIVRQTLSDLAQRNGSTGGNRVFTVEVLNGSGVTGLAGRTAELIRGFGYDVINVGNADSADYAFTEIIDRSNFSGEAKKFAEIIKCKRVITVEEEKPFQDGMVMPLEDYNYKADFTLILGRDFDGRYTQG